MRTDIEFKTGDGTTLRGWHYLPKKSRGRFPTIVMAHGFSATKEVYLDKYAAFFAKAGLAVVVYDHRNFGTSDGKPRQEIDPWQQVRDYRDAITFAESLPNTDRDRIGIFGSSYSGGHVLVVAAIDRRVKCVVAQVPFISGPRNARRIVRTDQIAAMRGMFDADRRDRAAGKKPAMIPVVAPEGSPCALPTPDSYWFKTTVADQYASTWLNEITLRSVEMFMEYEPGGYIRYVSPTPLLVVVAAEDHLTVTDLALEAYENALEPKKLIVLPGGHFGAYVDHFAVSGGGARDWFVEHLAAR
ncbi:MAG: alpha/beta hydrolase [Nevskia sp.]